VEAGSSVWCWPSCRSPWPAGCRETPRCSASVNLASRT
jgi:hypothetical protein